MHGFNAWHRAADQGSLDALEILWIWTKEAEISKDELLLSQNEWGYNAFQLAGMNKHEETLKRMLVWAKGKQLLTNELENNLLINEDPAACMAWNKATTLDRLEALQKKLIGLKKWKFRKMNC